MNFNSKVPSILVVDNFYKDPDEIVKFANEQVYTEDLRYYKGLRSERFLFPYVKEEFERLLGNVKIIDWLNQPFNGCFQKTNSKDPLVWHSDTQQYAAAVYLTKESEQMGTSFWKDKRYGNRRPPLDIEESNEVYSEYNITHPDNWELVDKIGAVYNRLVIWDAKLIHSASSYQSDKERLIQLYFFTTNTSNE